MDEEDYDPVEYENAKITSETSVAAIPTLLITIAELKVIREKTNADITPKDTKDVARATITVARQLIRMSRLLLDHTEVTDDGGA